jgi:hypothetical protein
MHSRRWAFRTGKIAQIVFMGLLVSGLSARVSDSRRTVGLPEDWTHHRIKFSTAALRQHFEIAAREPRAAMQLYREAIAAARRATPSAATESLASPSPHPDWSVNLGAGRIQFGQFPAKWNADPNATPDCVGDFIIYALNAAGATGGQAGMVAFNNLYAGNGTALCPGLQPNFLFSYNTTTVTGGRILTSPVLSLDGTKVAFVETVTTAGAKTSVFHVLNIPAGNSNPGPGFPNGNSALAAVAVPGGAMTSLAIGGNSNTRSSPWVDYASDTAYVALDNGRLYKIQPVFGSTPALISTAPWPIVINNNSVLTSPVLDVTGNVFLGAGNGNVYSVNVTSTTPVVSVLHVGTSGLLNPSIYDSPILDSTGGSVFAISSNDSNNSAVVVQASTSSLTEIARVSIGQGSTNGTNVNLYDGDFDNNFTTPLTGHMLVCGTGLADTIPNRYLLGFDAAGKLQPDLSPVPLSTNPAARCGPVTEFFNTNVNGGTDFFFWSLTRNCGGAAGNNGCVMSLANGVAGPSSAKQVGGTSGIIVDNNSTAGQASSIHFCTQNAPNNAVKLTQTGLN